MKKFLFFFVLVMVVISLFPVNCFVVSDGLHEKVYSAGSHNVTIKYIHSVERSTVIEVLHVNSSGIYAKEMWWKDFGAGLPEDIQFMKNGFYVKKINIPLGKSLDFWFLPLNRAKIYVDGHLEFKPSSDTLIHFQVKKCMLIQKIVGRC